MLRGTIKLSSFQSFMVDATKAAVRPFSTQPTGASDAAEYSQAKSYSKIPGPGFFRTLYDFSPVGEFHNASIDAIHRSFRARYGDLVRLKGSLGKKDILLSFNPEDYQKVFRAEPKWPYRPPLETLEYYRTVYRPEAFQGTRGLTLDQGETWYNFRSLVNPTLMQPRTVKLYTKNVDEIARDFIEVVKNLRNEKNETPADFHQWLNRWALETTGVVALDSRLGVLQKKPSDEAQLILQNMRLFFELCYELEIKPSIWKYISTPKFKKLMNAFDKITDIVKKNVDEAVIRLEQEPSADESSQGVLERLLKVNREVAYMMAFDMLMAGVDTTTSAVSGVLYCLANNPEKQRILREELRNALPNKDTPFTPENMDRLPYLRACIKEGARMFPAVFGISRQVGKDIVLQGYQVPEGTRVAMATMILQYQDENFPRAKEFLPERWLRENTSDCQVPRHTHSYLYFPFGNGPRACVGKRLANMELEILIGKFVRQFEIGWNYGELKFGLAIVNIPITELKFQLRELAD